MARGLLTAASRRPRAPPRADPLRTARKPVSLPSVAEEAPITVPSGFELSLELVDFAAGCCGGCVGVLFGHPFDTLKVRLQSDTLNTKSSPIQVLRGILKTEGFMGLVKGIETPLLGNVPVQAIVFGAYGAILRRMGVYFGDGASPDEQPVWQHTLAGCFAGIAQAPVVAAAEYCKTQMQLQTAFTSRKEVKAGRGHAAAKVLYVNSIDCASYVVRHHGPFAIFRGTAITLWRDVSYGQWFGQYEMTKRWLIARGGGGAESKMFPIYSALAGACAGVCGWVLIYPMDCVKTRIQARQASEARYRIVDAVREMWREQPHGRAFTRGLGVCLVRAVPVNMVTFMTYEAVMAFGAGLHESRATCAASM